MSISNSFPKPSHHCLVCSVMLPSYFRIIILYRSVDWSTSDHFITNSKTFLTLFMFLFSFHFSIDDYHKSTARTAPK